MEDGDSNPKESCGSRWYKSLSWSKKSLFWVMALFVGVPQAMFTLGYRLNFKR